MSDLTEYLAGERLDDVALFLRSDQLDDEGALEEAGDAVDGGVVLVVDGERGRELFAAGTGRDAMGFARTAGDRDGGIPDLGGGVCPDADGPGDDAHGATFVFSFAQARNEGVGGLYAEGDVIHAYAQCECGEAYSQKWVVGERPVPEDG